MSGICSKHQGHDPGCDTCNALVNAGHYHEIIDRSFIICGMIDDYLIGHPGMTKKMNSRCEKAQGLLVVVANGAAVEMDKWEDK